MILLASFPALDLTVLVSAVLKLKLLELTSLGNIASFSGPEVLNLLSEDLFVVLSLEWVVEDFNWHFVDEVKFLKNFLHFNSVLTDKICP